MLSKNQVVKVQKALERLYTGKCTVTVHEEYDKPNGSTGFHDAVTFSDEPCRVSFSRIAPTSGGEAAATVVQSVRLHIAPGIIIPPGCKITVTQNDVTTDYTRSGEPAIYDTHQEIDLELFERWS